MGMRKGKKYIPRAGSDVGLDSQHTVLMDECVCLADETHYFIPGSFYLGSMISFDFVTVKTRCGYTGGGKWGRDVDVT